MSKVFISYRRDDSKNVTGRIYDRLRLHFGYDSVFIDVDSIRPGEDFREHLKESLGQSAVLLAVVGPSWLDARGKDGKRRLDDPQDFVRMEIELALEHNVTVIPVLVDGSRMPAESDLPDSLSEFSFRQAAVVRSDPDFDPDMRRLIRDVDTTAPESPQIRLRSTPESAAAGQISIVAVVETIVAVTFSLWLAIHYQTVTHIVVGACIAPFLLLRTEYSTNLAIEWFKNGSRGEYFVDWLISVVAGVLTRSYPPLNQTVPKFPWWVCVVGAVPAGIMLLLFFPACRMLATLTALVRQPLVCISAIPVNWRRLVLATDMFHPPEILPGIETNQPDSYILTVSRFRTFVTSNREKTELLQLFHGSVVVLMAVVLFMPTVVYRLSIKSTCVVYLPFLWIIRSRMSDDTTVHSVVDDYLEDNRHGAIERLQRWYASLVLLITLGSIVLPATRLSPIAGSLDRSGPVLACLRDLYLPTDGREIRFHSWHVARVINALIVIGLFAYADRAARRLKKRRWTHVRVHRDLRFAWFIQMCLTLFTTACVLSQFSHLAVQSYLALVGSALVPRPR